MVLLIPSVFSYSPSNSRAGFRLGVHVRCVANIVSDLRRVDEPLIVGIRGQRSPFPYGVCKDLIRRLASRYSQLVVREWNSGRMPVSFHRMYSRTRSSASVKPATLPAESTSMLYKNTAIACDAMPGCFGKSWSRLSSSGRSPAIRCRVNQDIESRTSWQSRIVPDLKEPESRMERRHV